MLLYYVIILCYYIMLLYYVIILCYYIMLLYYMLNNHRNRVEIESVEIESASK